MKSARLIILVAFANCFVGRADLFYDESEAGGGRQAQVASKEEGSGYVPVSNVFEDDLVSEERRLQSSPSPGGGGNGGGVASASRRQWLRPLDMPFLFLLVVFANCFAGRADLFYDESEAGAGRQAQVASKEEGSGYVPVSNVFEDDLVSEERRLQSSPSPGGGGNGVASASRRQWLRPLEMPFLYSFFFAISLSWLK